MKNQTTLNHVKHELVRTVQEVGEEFRNLNWDSKKVYLNWLAQTYYYVQHTTCFIALMAARWGPKNREKQYQALNFLNGEAGHDLLLIDDLKFFKANISEFEEFLETQLFYQNQYYLVEHETPAAQLGYAFFLEGIASTQARHAYDKVKHTYGPEAGTFLKVHAEEDPEHFQMGLKMLEGFGNDDLLVIEKSLRQSALLYSQMLKKM
jgi:pyrroloquinoline quinone (PQQ) biosynthesis protein C